VASTAVLAPTPDLRERDHIPLKAAIVVEKRVKGMPTFTRIQFSSLYDNAKRETAA